DRRDVCETRTGLARRAIHPRGRHIGPRRGALLAGSGDTPVAGITPGAERSRPRVDHVLRGERSERRAADRDGRSRRRGPVGRARRPDRGRAGADPVSRCLDRTDAPRATRRRPGEDDPVTFLSTAVQNVLQEGQFCAVATTTPAGPHCTPLVYALSGGRIWLTTSRRSVKARAWRSDPSVSGLVRHGDLSVTFTGRAHPFDILDRGTWSAAVAQGPQVARAGLTFGRKNARFFAGYAMDAKQVPFAWTPPGRVFVAIDIDRTALLDAEGVQEGWSRSGGDVRAAESFRASRKGS